MTKPEFIKLVWKFAKKMKLDKDLIDVEWFTNNEDPGNWGRATWSNVIMFNEDLPKEGYMLIVDTIIHELVHIKQHIEFYRKNKTAHNEQYFKDFKFWFKKLKNIK
jgi:hypothetical protein